jgi:hypothetical protein
MGRLSRYVAKASNKREKGHMAPAHRDIYKYAYSNIHVFSFLDWHNARLAQDLY